MSNDKWQIIFSVLIKKRSRIAGRGCLFISDPGNEQASPVLSGLSDLHADARGSINGRRQAHYGGGGFGGRAVRAMRADVKFFADTNFLIQMKKRTGRRNIIGLSWFAAGSAVI